MSFEPRPPHFALSIALLAVVGCGTPAVEKNSTPRQVRSESEPPAAAMVVPAEEEPGNPSPPRDDDWFEDVTAKSGVAFRYNNGREGRHFTILETIGGGVALFDCDGDRDLDLLFTGGGHISPGQPPKITGLPAGLYRNDGDCRFTEVTGPSGVGTPGDYSHGCISADYDRDGFADLFITCFGRCQLLRNQGDGTFRNMSHEAGLEFSGWSTAAAWADVDNDGWLDLYVAQYCTWDATQVRECLDPTTKIRDICPPQDYPPASDRLFRNRHDGTFAEITSEAGIRDEGRGLGVLATDLNDDGWVDFYVVNDVGANFLYLGGSELQFREVGMVSGVAYSEFGLTESGMGVEVSDYNADGWPDLWVTNFELENNSLYRGASDGLFTHAIVSAGLAGTCFPYVKFGTCFDDLNGDGWPDLFVSNGNVYYHRGKKGYRQPAFLFQNIAGNSFTDVSARGGPYFSVSHVGRGAALGDLDNDGALDLVVVHQNDPAAILRNRLTSSNWVGLALRGTSANREAIGARVSVPFQGRNLVRWVRSGAGYFSQFDQRLTFPCNNQSLDVTITWPGGRREFFSGLTPGRYHEVVEGEGAVPAP